VNYKRSELQRVISSVNGSSRLEEIAARSEMETQRALTYLLHLHDADIVGTMDVRDTSGNYSRLWYRR
jgi:hypothetical protein